MRLWHQDLISKLPRQQLLGQHREICALRGNGWGKKHSVVNYVFTYDPEFLYAYHVLVMDEMMHRGFKIEPSWINPAYRGKKCPPHRNINESKIASIFMDRSKNIPIYKEHNTQYMTECIENLKRKNIEIK